MRLMCDRMESLSVKFQKIKGLCYDGNPLSPCIKAHILPSFLGVFIKISVKGIYYQHGIVNLFDFSHELD